jgi:hypothetical protein
VADDRKWPNFTHYWKPDPIDSGKHFATGQTFFLEAELLDENNDPIRDEVVELTIQRPDMTSYGFSGITNNQGVARIEVIFDVEGLLLVTVNWNGNAEYRGMGSAFDVYVKKGSGFGLPIYLLLLPVLILLIIFFFLYRRWKK